MLREQQQKMDKIKYGYSKAILEKAFIKFNSKYKEAFAKDFPWKKPSMKLF